MIHCSQSAVINLFGWGGGGGLHSHESVLSSVLKWATIVSLTAPPNLSLAVTL
jgi:hypothetical protein